MLAEVFFVDLFERAEFITTGIVDEDVDVAEVILGLFEKTIDVGLFGDIGLNDKSFPPLASIFFATRSAPALSEA